MPLNVLYYTDSAGFGGAEQALLTLIEGLDRNRWRPMLAVHPEPGIEPLLEGARKLDVPLWVAPRMPEGSHGAAHVPSFVRELRSRHPAVFHANLSWPRACKYGLIAATLARVRAIVATEHLFVQVPHNRMALLQQRLISNGVGRYIAVSGEVASQLQQTYRIPRHKMQVIYNAVATDPFQRVDGARLRATLWGKQRRPVILTVSRLHKQKGHCYLLEAATLVPEALFVLAGEGEEREALEMQTKTLGLEERVIFLGFRKDVPELLASCDLFVLPSLYEGLPLAVLEAMAAGKPVIATDIGGTDEAVVNGKTGLLAPPCDAPALAAAIRQLLADPLLAQRLAYAGKARVQQVFSAGAMVQQITGVYDELLAQHILPRAHCI